LVKFHPDEYFNNKVKPKFGFNQLIINDSIYQMPGKQLILPSGKYKLVLDYKGVSFNNSQNLQYFYFLQGFDDEWHDGSMYDRAIYKNLSSGDYCLQIRACVDGDCEEKIAPFTIKIKQPIWQSLWFWTFMACLIILLFLFLFWVQEQANVRKKKVLQYNIQLKTKELNLKNEHIMSSINYAKRIQNALFPSLPKEPMGGFFAGEINLPKDVVGGDFIWFFNNQKGRYYFALCDCTGHGVPGGFMTVLSNSMLNAIVTRDPDLLPNEILDQLHDAIDKQLHTNKDSKVVDGLDAGVICIDTNTNQLYFSGANRPLVCFDKQGKMSRFKGSRKSIGDLYRKNKFELVELDCQDISSIYLYCDGFTDQFGGMDQKKYGTNRLLDFLLKCQKEDARKQAELLGKEIYNWKKTAEFQTDDISLLVLSKFIKT
jgi:serine phosphatase RsbU (regulator of sigma subunit)